VTDPPALSVEEAGALLGSPGTWRTTWWRSVSCHPSAWADASSCLVDALEETLGRLSNAAATDGDL
jgi:hypothetical protein